LDRSAEIEFLRSALRRRVDQTSVRHVALEVKMSHGGIYNLVNHAVAPYGKTLAKLRAWYLDQWARRGEGLTTESARYLTEQMLGPIPRGVRDEARTDLLDGLVVLFRRFGSPPPAWLHGLLREPHVAVEMPPPRRKPRWRVRGALRQLRSTGAQRPPQRRTLRVGGNGSPRGPQGLPGVRAVLAHHRIAREKRRVAGSH
jgi:hypothetical protein